MIITDQRERGFSMVELLAAIAALSILGLVLAGITNEFGRAWLMGESQVQKRRSSRALLEFISGDLRSALVPLVQTASSTQSNIQFLLNPPDANLPGEILNPCALFWVAPLATNRDYGNLAEIGYFVRYRANGSNPAFQLCRFFVNPGLPNASDPDDSGNDYKIFDSSNRYAWLDSGIIDKYTSATAPDYRGLFAENVIGFWVRCLDPLGKPITSSAQYNLPDGTPVPSSAYPAGTYDSMKGYRYTDSGGKTIDVAPPALPASVEIAVVLLDSRTAVRLTPADASQIRSSYNLVNQASDIPDYIQALPPAVRQMARSFTTRIELMNAR